MSFAPQTDRTPGFSTGSAQSQTQPHDPIQLALRDAPTPASDCSVIYPGFSGDSTISEYGDLKSSLLNNRSARPISLKGKTSQLKMNPT